MDTPMNESTMAVELAKPQALQTVPVAKDIELTATLPEEMQLAQVQLIEWCKNKILELKSDLADLEGAYNHAKKHAWKYSTYKTHALKCAKRITYYEKVLGALEAGYCIVPNFPVTVFAIRTKRKDPEPGYVDTHWSSHEQPSQILAPGVGCYQNPLPVIRYEQRKVPKPDNPNNMIHSSWASDWNDIDFPINMAKPRIMEAATNAMAIKLFDELGVLPSPYKREDPMVLGIVKNPCGAPASFLIAWHLKTKDL